MTAFSIIMNVWCKQIAFVSKSPEVCNAYGFPNRKLVIFPEKSYIGFSNIWGVGAGDKEVCATNLKSVRGEAMLCFPLFLAKIVQTAEKVCDLDRKKPRADMCKRWCTFYKTISENTLWTNVNLKWRSFFFHWLIDWLIDWSAACVRYVHSMWTKVLQHVKKIPI